ncbi:MAG: DUF721 domain-containing protein [Melioribacteraceae bacterium]|nr:DUF721 domain-containing protein [Melioribacteraceae bacterium]
MPNNFRSISDVLFKEKEFSKIVAKAKEEEIVQKFKEIFPELNEIAKAIKFKKNVLFLRVENSVWRSELNLKQTAIISKIENHFNNIQIDKIKFIS